ncbi:thermostable hemolysin, partial [Nocardioides antri]
RHQVVEVGNLAGVNCRAAMRMVAALPAYLLARDYRWIVFTATSAVRGILQGFDAPLVELARADGSRVSG